MTFGTEYRMGFVMLSFIDDVRLTDKPKSVASGAVSIAVDEEELQEASFCCSGNVNRQSRT